MASANGQANPYQHYREERQKAVDSLPDGPMRETARVMNDDANKAWDNARQHTPGTPAYDAAKADAMSKTVAFQQKVNEFKGGAGDNGIKQQGADGTLASVDSKLEGGVPANPPTEESTLVAEVKAAVGKTDSIAREAGDSGGERIGVEYNISLEQGYAALSDSESGNLGDGVDVEDSVPVEQSYAALPDSESDDLGSVDIGLEDSVSLEHSYASVAEPTTNDNIKTREDIPEELLQAVNQSRNEIAGLSNISQHQTSSKDQSQTVLEHRAESKCQTNPQILEQSAGMAIA